MAGRAIKIFPSVDELTGFAASTIIDIIILGTRRGRRTSIALSGGTTPRAVYEKLAGISRAGALDWKAVHLFWGDERLVPPDNAGSNYRMARQSLISRIPIPPENIHRIRGELSAGEAAERYEGDLRDFFGAVGFPAFDLVLLGLGADGHTASLFPHSSALKERQRWVTTAESGGMQRVTLTLPVLNSAEHVIFIASGKEKAEAVFRTLSGPQSPEDRPAEGVNPIRGNVLWLLDKRAASLLGGS
ncbi:MAG: 6-phosphogluconolactonase [bacterium]